MYVERGAGKSQRVARREGTGIEVLRRTDVVLCWIIFDDRFLKREAVVRIAGNPWKWPRAVKLFARSAKAIGSGTAWFGVRERGRLICMPGNVTATSKRNILAIHMHIRRTSYLIALCQLTTAHTPPAHTVAPLTGDLTALVRPPFLRRFGKRRKFVGSFAKSTPKLSRLLSARCIPWICMRELRMHKALKVIFLPSPVSLIVFNSEFLSYIEILKFK